MNILLDSCLILWMAEDASLISPRAREHLEDTSNTLVISQVSFLELQLKFISGKLPLLMKPREIIRHICSEHIADYLPLDDNAVELLEKLPPIHADPFDRLLIAQALTHQLALMTPDTKIHDYPLMTIW